jgi:GT2 family glycosyltransferase
VVNLSVIIPTRNSAKFIIPCLDSVFKQKAQNSEIILVDNASSDSTVSLVRKYYPQVRIIENQSNLGAAKARNQALASAQGEWIITLDCDVILRDDFLLTFLKIAQASPPEAGILQPKILDINNGNIYSAGIRFSFLNRFHDIAKGMPDSEKFNTPKPVFGACCAAALYRRKMLEAVKDRHGYFDERFFFLFEDADLSWRAQKKGWVCLYCPQVKCDHYGNSSLTNDKSRQYLSFRNRQLMILKNQNSIVTLLMLPLYLAYDLPRFLILLFRFKFRFPETYIIQAKRN